MLHALGWSIALMLFALWSLAAWALHAVVAWTASNAGALATGTTAIGTAAIPGWLAPWIPAGIAPALASMPATLAPLVESALNTVPALAGGLTFAVWVVWGIGSLVILLLGLFGSRLVAGLQRHGSAIAATPFRP